MFDRRGAKEAGAGACQPSERRRPEGLEGSPMEAGQMEPDGMITKPNQTDIPI